MKIHAIHVSSTYYCYYVRQRVSSRYFLIPFLDNKKKEELKKKKKKIIEIFVKFHRRFFFVIITFAKREKETIAQRSSSAYIKNLIISKKPSRSLEEINDDDIRLRLHTQKYLRNRLLRNLRPHVLRVSALVQVP